ncbi:hypothetical protein HK101_008882 [Irineochytrium annulatum]|nr:hypothetical protein HK101_008882 [Irineochytrium annulatum]
MTLSQFWRFSNQRSAEVDNSKMPLMKMGLNRAVRRSSSPGPLSDPLPTSDPEPRPSTSSDQQDRSRWSFSMPRRSNDSARPSLAAGLVEKARRSLSLSRRRNGERQPSSSGSSSPQQIASLSSATSDDGGGGRSGDEAVANQSFAAGLLERARISLSRNVSRKGHPRRASPAPSNGSSPPASLGSHVEGSRPASSVAADLLGKAKRTLSIKKKADKEALPPVEPLDVWGERLKSQPETRPLPDGPSEVEIVDIPDEVAVEPQVAILGVADSLDPPSVSVTTFPVEHVEAVPVPKFKGNYWKKWRADSDARLSSTSAAGDSDIRLSTGSRVGEDIRLSTASARTLGDDEEGTGSFNVLKGNDIDIVDEPFKLGRSSMMYDLLRRSSVTDEPITVMRLSVTDDPIRLGRSSVTDEPVKLGRSSVTDIRTSVVTVVPSARPSVVLPPAEVENKPITPPATAKPFKAGLNFAILMNLPPGPPSPEPVRAAPPPRPITPEFASSSAPPSPTLAAMTSPVDLAHLDRIAPRTHKAGGLPEEGHTPKCKTKARSKLPRPSTSGLPPRAPRLSGSGATSTSGRMSTPLTKSGSMSRIPSIRSRAASHECVGGSPRGAVTPPGMFRRVQSCEAGIGGGREILATPPVVIVLKEEAEEEMREEPGPRKGVMGEVVKRMGDMGMRGERWACGVEAMVGVRSMVKRRAAFVATRVEVEENSLV